MLVQGTQRRNYILVVIAEADNGAEILGDILVKVEDLLHSDDLELASSTNQSLQHQEAGTCLP